MIQTLRDNRLDPKRSQKLDSSAAHHWSENGYLMDIDGHSQDDSRGEPEQVS